MLLQKQVLLQKQMLLQKLMLLLELRLLLKTAKAANIANAAKLLLQNESEELRSKEAVVLAAEQQDYMTSEHVILLRMDGVHCHASELACPTTIRRVHLAIISTMACSRLHAREGMTAVFSTYPCCAGCSMSSNDVSSSLSSSERSTSAARYANTSPKLTSRSTKRRNWCHTATTIIAPDM